VRFGKKEERLDRVSDIINIWVDNNLGRGQSEENQRKNNWNSAETEQGSARCWGPFKKPLDSKTSWKKGGDVMR